MKSFFIRLWSDENFFLRAAAVVLMFAGYGFTTGKIPTGVDGLGPDVGILFQAISVGLATGKWQLPK